MKKVTIKDVAREVGMSISTVSNALNDVDVLRPETKAYILEVADRMHYIPNLNGRNLKAQSTRVIGLFVSFMGGPYMGALTDSMARQCMEAGYEMQVFVTGQNKSVMSNLLGCRVDGGVIVNSMLSKKQEKELQTAAIPIVYLNKETVGEYQSGVFFDSYEAGKMAAQYLINKDLCRLGLIEGPDNYDSKERSRGFRDVLMKHNMELKNEFVWQGGFSRDITFHAINNYLTKIKGSNEKHLLPDGIFAAADVSAIGCMEALAQAGIRVPEDVKILGCDDIELCRYINPPLTTIRTNFEEQGKVALQCLLAMLQGESAGKQMRLSCKMVERETA